MTDYSPWIAAALFVIAAVLWKPLARDRGRVRTAFGLLILWVAFFLFAGAASRWNVQAHAASEIARTLLILTGVQIGAMLLFDVALRKVRLPKFAGEIAIVAAYVVALVQLLNRLGANATGIFATSAVATAVLGLALQDMLSNIAGGISLELEGTLETGDFIRCGDHSGWVQHIRLRHTAIITADSDTVILPNSLLTRSPVVVVSKAHRRFLSFSMWYSRDPQEVTEAVRKALRSSPLEGVAPKPEPDCIIEEMTPGHVRYAAVVWLTTPGHDSEAVSLVLNRVYYALQRAGIPASEISYLVETKAAVPLAEEASPTEILSRTPIFRLLGEKGIAELSASLRRLSFAPGEHILRQGDSGDSMYFVVAGTVGITFHSGDGPERQIATFESGDFFGEASLLTGEPRSATATAVSRVTCYRLDKAGLQRTMELQPELAEDMSVVMAHRQIELASARDKMDRETALRRESESQTQLLARIRRFFGINSASTRA